MAILGPGYPGLRTAGPDLRIAIVEKEIVDFGASGRNGDRCCSRFLPATIVEALGKH